MEDRCHAFPLLLVNSWAREGKESVLFGKKQFEHFLQNHFLRDAYVENALCSAIKCCQLACATLDPISLLSQEMDLSGNISHYPI
jgi:hypothetical protein